MRTRHLNWCLCCPRLSGVLHQGMKQWKGCSPKGCHLAFGSQTVNLRESSFSVTHAVVFWYGSRQQAETILVSLTSAVGCSHTFGNRMCKGRVGRSDSLGRRRKHWYHTVKRSSGGGGWAMDWLGIKSFYNSKQKMATGTPKFPRETSYTVGEWGHL